MTLQAPPPLAVSAGENSSRWMILQGGSEAQAGILGLRRMLEGWG